MTLQDIVRDLAQHLNLTQKYAREALLRVESKITEGLLSDGVVRLGGLGTFKLRIRPARQYRNPQTGGPVVIPSRRVVTFRPGKQLKETVVRMPSP